MSQPIIEQIMVGKPQIFGQKEATQPMDREWESGIVKPPVYGKVWVNKTKLEGDGQADLKNHGGPEKAIFAYPASHYAFWQSKLSRPDFILGAFGENLAVHGLTEEDVCIGDTISVGEAIVQVSQPRQPCWKPARRWKIKELALLIQQEGYTGWYFRVLKEGYIEAGDPLQLQERPFPEWTIAKCNEVMHVQKDDLDLAKRLAACEYLASSWREALTKRVQGKGSSDIRNRVFGPNEW